jgi:signal transduction histidine kinase
MMIHRYVRSRLHRRLFVWFGLTIAFSVVLVGAVMFALSGLYRSTWHDDVERMERFASGRFAHVWDRPEEREELARAIAETLRVAVRLDDASGKELGSYGEGGCRSREMSTTVRDASGAVLGEVSVCVHHRNVAGWKFVVPLLLIGLVLWGASGKIARRLARPLGEVARVAEEIGRGRLHSRAHLECAMPDEIGVLAISINDMADRIERQLHDQRVLLAAVSHELRTPLGHLRILLELIRSNGSDEKTVDELEREVVEIDTLVGELLASSRLDFTAITKKRLDAVDVARRALDRAGIEQAALRAEEAELAFEGDATLIARALANLIDNARKHGGGVEALVVKKNGDGSVVFEVEDTGPGFPDGENGEVFEPFYRAQNGKRSSENGTLGLGLSLVKRIAEAHGGRAYAGQRGSGGARVGFEIAAAAEVGAPI